MLACDYKMGLFVIISTIWEGSAWWLVCDVCYATEASCKCLWEKMLSIILNILFGFCVRMWQHISFGLSEALHTRSWNWCIFFLFLLSPWHFNVWHYHTPNLDRITINQEGNCCILMHGCHVTYCVSLWAWQEIKKYGGAEGEKYVWWN